uniref:CG-1 domain-containing protein n=1 Tax=Timema cristinae TaxID=61476 RepID=A0A7R9CLI7_TIMCR|nr:unnamed protein product [Timema cristinae]
MLVRPCATTLIYTLELYRVDLDLVSAEVTGGTIFCKSLSTRVERSLCSNVPDSDPPQRQSEIAAILISFERHSEWQSKEVKIRPKSGSMLLYSRKKVRYRRDGYCWKKRKDGKTTREDHMKLKVQGTECIYGCYVHSAILPTFHRRCYWLLQTYAMNNITFWTVASRQGKQGKHCLPLIEDM